MVGCTLLGAIITYLTFVRGRDKDIQSTTAKQTTMEITMRHLVESHGELKADIKGVANMQEQLTRNTLAIEDHEKRLNKLEER